MSKTPYSSLSSKAFWKHSISNKDMSMIDPIIDFPKLINLNTKVATAGSCFAQNIAKRLSNSGYNYYVTENGHEILGSEINKIFNYGTFSARYGNIYTTRQLLQLFKRAFNTFQPKENSWMCTDGSVRDPFRPNIQPGGFVSEGSMIQDRSTHLEKVRQIFINSDVFIFTMGLTECWRSKEDGAVFPICPGVEGGNFQEKKHEFYNQTVQDVVYDFEEFYKLVKSENPEIKIILTVSPVPLLATARKDVDVLTATTYSKSVLRVAAESLSTRLEDTFYFPSYEIITGNFNRGSYYSNDLRNVVEDGVDHVMKVFFDHATDSKNENAKPVTKTRERPRQTIADIECDEELIGKQYKN